VLDAEGKTRLIGNIAAHIGPANIEIKERQIKLFYKCDPEYGNRVAQALGLPVHKPKL